MSAPLDRIGHIADLLLGAAYADQHLAGKEEAAVRRLLGELVGQGGVLPGELDQRLRKFQPATFKLAETAKQLAAEPKEQKRKLLELIAQVHAADDELDLDEDRYLRDVAKALGVPEAEYKDLALEVLEDEELKDSLSDLFR